MTAYVVGFLVAPSEDLALLIRKRRPAWQAGLLNGIGGHVEEGEGHDDAMVREFREETGIHSTVKVWERMLMMHFPAHGGGSHQITFYRWQVPTLRHILYGTTTDEEVECQQISPLLLPGARIIPNLRWLLPMAAYTADRYQVFDLHATVAEVLTGASE